MPISEGDGPDPLIASTFAGLLDEFDGFAKIYQNEIRPALIAREQARIAAVSKARKMSIIGAVVGVAGVLAAILLVRQPIMAILAIIVGFGIAAWGWKDLNAMRAVAKETLINPIAQRLGIAFQAMPGSVASIERHRSVKLVPRWDRISFEDLITGKRNGVDFELFEAHLKQRRQSHSNGKTRTRWVTVFNGQCLRFNFHKTFYGRTLVTRDSGFFNRFGGGKGLKRAKLEDPRFEKIFEVYTNDQVESRFLLTPDLMQNLVDLETTFQGKKLKCCFDEGELLITLEGGNLFEPGSMLSSLDNPERARELLNDFAAMFEVIDSVSDGRAREERERDT